MARKPFGGYTISFDKVGDWPISKIFGSGSVTPSDMTKKLWAFVKKNNLSKK